jgi:D-hydroxyproline dehydrogenase subunit alpha
MSRASRYEFDVLVIGGGPAGIAAASSAAEGGSRVGIVDDNGTLGGQIWRGEAEDPKDSSFLDWTERLRSTGAIVLCGLRVFHQPAPNVLLAEGNDQVCELRYAKLILATGARERFLPFPGWTLPNVMGAGGLQALVKRGLPIQGKRVVIAGTGPLLLAVAAYLHKKGAVIAAICEQASGSSLAGFGVAMLRQPGKIVQGLQLGRELAGVRFVNSTWPVSAEGDSVLKSVTISRHGKSETIACDYLGCGFHLVPNTELPLLLGCRVQDGFVVVDEFQKTTVPDVFCAGEPTGIGGVELSLLEGEVAGLAATGRTEQAAKLFRKRAGMRKFTRALEDAFRLRAELRGMALADTIVCRCEDVTYSALSQSRSWRAAKLHTRCGMGACQGRVCGPATQFHFRWNPDSVRPPVFPVRVASLAAMNVQMKIEGNEVIGDVQ